MALNKAQLEQDIKKSANTAAEDAYNAAMNVKVTDPALISKLTSGDYAEYSKLLITEQAKMFAKVFSETLSPLISNDIDKFVKSGDTDIKITEVFTGIIPVINDGGAAVIAQLIKNAKIFDAKPTNGKVK